MRTLFLPTLVNGLDGDPALWVDLLDEGRAVLFDLGDLHALAPRKLARVDFAVVTHAHMDHFCGFDRLLRLALRREREIVLVGPAGFGGHVASRIAGYAWNLVEGYPVRLRVREVDGAVVRDTIHRGAGRMLAEPAGEAPFSGTVHAERLFTIEVAVLDHGIPVLAAALREVEHLGVDKDALDRLGLAPGPWLATLKDLARRREPGATPVEAAAADGGARVLPLAELEGRLLRRGPGQKIAYVTDAAFTPENVERIVALARDADLMVCETPFLHEDVAEAARRGHLSARQAGEIARAAGVRRLAPFHVSPRYQGREREVVEEAARAFGGTLLELPGARE
ncbi:MAG TPA: MBL fold metallo-hydrolase [Candidatus Polarisedimenticolaceae bacterium]